MAGFFLWPANRRLFSIFWPVLPSLAVTQTHLAVHQGLIGLLGGKVDADVTYTVVNTGNVRLTPQAIVEADPLIGFGKTLRHNLLLLRHPLKIGQVL